MVLRGADDSNTSEGVSGIMVDGGRLAARTLKEAGVDVVFALHGGHLEAFFSGCEEMVFTWWIRDMKPLPSMRRMLIREPQASWAWRLSPLDRV